MMDASRPPHLVKAASPAGGDRPEERATPNAGSELARRGGPGDAESNHLAQPSEHGILHHAGEGLRASPGYEVEVEEVEIEVEAGRELRRGAGAASHRDEHAKRSGRPRRRGSGGEGPSASQPGHGAAAEKPAGDINWTLGIGHVGRAVGDRGRANPRSVRRVAPRNLEGGNIHGWRAGRRQSKRCAGQYCCR